MTNVSCSIPCRASFATCSGVRSPSPDCGPFGIDLSMSVSTPCGQRMEPRMPWVLCEIARFSANPTAACFVDTDMLRSIPKGPQSGDGDLTPEQVANDALAGLEQETFLILPHPQVLGYMRKKTENYDRWISGIAKIQAKMQEASGQ